MAVQIGFKKAVNDVIMHFTRDPEQLAVGANATAAKMLPGIAVIFDTNDHDVKECGAAGAAIGVLGYARAHPDFKPLTQLTAYALGDEVPVYNGPGRVFAYLTETIVKGEPLVLAADGKFSKAAAITIVASGSGNITDGQAVTGTYGADGPVVARAAESRTGAGRSWINLTGV
jgi:hypothetical protein